jgi:hypothetical protein
MHEGKEVFRGPTHYEWAMTKSKGKVPLGHPGECWALMAFEKNGDLLGRGTDAMMYNAIKKVFEYADEKNKDPNLLELKDVERLGFNVIPYMIT